MTDVLRRKRPFDRCLMTSFDLAPKPDEMYSHIYNYIYFVFLTVKLSNKVVNWSTA